MKDEAQRPQIAEILSGTDFLRPGTVLAIGYEGVPGRPLSAFERMFVIIQGRPLRIRTYDDLVGKVRIDSEVAALRYTRLFTSPATVRALVKPRWLEVIPASAVDEHFVFGRAEYRNRLRNVKGQGHYRAFGVLPDPEWSQCGLPRPTVSTTKAGFVVTRSLFSVDEDQSPQTDTVYQIAETVSSDGQIHRRTLSKSKLRGVALVVWPEE